MYIVLQIETTKIYLPHRSAVAIYMKLYEITWEHTIPDDLPITPMLRQKKLWLLNIRTKLKTFYSTIMY